MAKVNIQKTDCLRQINKKSLTTKTLITTSLVVRLSLSRPFTLRLVITHDLPLSRRNYYYILKELSVYAILLAIVIQKKPYCTDISLEYLPQ